MTREQAYAAFNLFVFADRAMIPTSADTASRYTVSIEPVQVFDYRDRKALTDAIEKAIAKGIPQIQDLSPEDAICGEDGISGVRNPIELKYAGATSWDELERKSIFFCIECYQSGYLIDCWGRQSNGKWSEAQSLELRLPGSVGVDGLVDQILGHLKTRKDLPGLAVDLNQPRTAKGA